MRLIKEIFNETLGLTSNKKDRAYNLARASRVVLFNENNEIALLNVKNEGYYKLPGGKIDMDESIEDAAYREIEEETGYKMRIIDDIGLIIEYSDDTNFMQISFAYKGEVVEKSVISLTANEIAQGIEVEWLDILKARDILNNQIPESYHGKFIVNRDLCFIEEVLK